MITFSLLRAHITTEQASLLASGLVLTNAGIFLLNDNNFTQVAAFNAGLIGGHITVLAMSKGDLSKAGLWGLTSLFLKAYILNRASRDEIESYTCYECSGMLVSIYGTVIMSEI